MGGGHVKQFVVRDFQKGGKKPLNAMSRNLMTSFSGGLEGLVQTVSASGVNNVVDAFVEMTQYNRTAEVGKPPYGSRT